MAIHNGNSDFNLVVTPEHSQKRFKIQFRRAASGPNPVDLRVQSPASTTIRNLDWSKRYMSLDGNTTVTEYVDVPAIGGYKISISTSQGYSHDYILSDIQLPGPQVSSIRTFTSSDIRAYNSGLLTFGIVIGAVGTYLARFSWPAFAITTIVSIAGWFYSSQTEWEDSLEPILGWSMQVRVTQPNLNTIRTTYFVYDQNGRLNKQIDRDSTVLRLGR